MLFRSNGPKPEIGRIDLLPGYTLFDVRKEDAPRVLAALRHADFFGDKIHAEIAEAGRDYAGETAGKRQGYRKGGKQKEKSKEKSKGKSARDFRDGSKPKKSGKDGKGKEKKKSKPKYNGSYDIFYK